MPSVRHTATGPDILLLIVQALAKGIGIGEESACGFLIEDISTRQVRNWVFEFAMLAYGFTHIGQKDERS
jgi:hypothetical protein